LLSVGLPAKRARVMHILFVSNNFSRPIEPGASRSWEMARYWVNRGHRVTVIRNQRHYMRADEDSEDWTRRQFVRRHRENGLVLIEVCSTKGRRRSLKHRIANYISVAVMTLVAGIFVKRVDLVYVRTPPILINFSGLLLSILKRVPFVLEIGDLHPDESVALGLVKSSFIIRVWDAWENYLRRRAHLIVAVVPGIKRLLVDKGFSAKKICVITNGYDLPASGDGRMHFSPEIRDLFFSKTKRFFIAAYAGSMGKAIPLECTVKAGKILQNRGFREVLFVYIGDGDNKQRLQDMCWEERIPNCIFLPPVPQSHIHAILAHADVLFHSVTQGTFHGYNLPNKIFTYLSVGKPIIYAGTGDVAEIIEQADCGIVVPPESSEEFASAIEYFVCHPAEMVAAGRKGQEFVLKNYDRRVILNRLEKRITELFPITRETGSFLEGS